jgi:acetyl esterase/lipase
MIEFGKLNKILPFVLALFFGSAGCGKTFESKQEKALQPGPEQQEASSVGLSGDSIPGWPGSVERVTIVSSYDSTPQPALFSAPPAGGGPSPLLVVLHTWSGDYLQQESVPYYELARERGWVFVHPNFRGPNKNPQATGSEAATADILDAVAYAKTRARVDNSRIYLVGTSGGGHMTLLTAARQPELWAAASAWVPISILALWYGECFERSNTVYARDMEASCGGPPVDGGPEVDAQYKLRSPLSVLHQAAGLPLEISAGIRDGHEGSVPVSQTLLAFNVLAQANEMPEKVIKPGQIYYFVTRAEVPDELKSEVEEDPAFGRKRVLFRRNAGPARVTIFDGAHEGIPEAAISWLEKHRKK